MLAYYDRMAYAAKMSTSVVIDDQPEASEKFQESIFQPAQGSESAQTKASRNKTEDQCFVQSWQDLLDTLGSLNSVTLLPSPRIENAIPIKVLTSPNQLHKRAFK